MKNTFVYLVRHGITGANLERKFAGRTDEPLHGDGVQQMSALGERLRKFRIHAIITGPLARTRQSAGIIAETLSTPVNIDDRLTDILIPHWDGLTKEEIGRRFGQQYPDWQTHPESFFLPGCESLHQVRERSVQLVEDIFEKFQGERILLVSHLVVLRCLVLYFRQQPMSAYRTVAIANGSICELKRVENGKTTILMDV